MTYSLEHMSLLHRAALMGANDLVQELLNSGEDPNTPTPDGFTPLHLAASSDNVEGLWLLLAAGADAGTRSGHGISPLWLATQEGSERAVAELLRVSGTAIDLDAANSAGQTPLTVAAVKGHVSILGMLLDAGADARRLDIDASEQSGITPLRQAVQNSDLAMVRLTTVAWCPHRHPLQERHFSDQYGPAAAERRHGRPSQEPRRRSPIARMFIEAQHQIYRDQ